MSLAPDQTGIGLRRYFTVAGVHPYDTVTWEKRDAKIANWKTGEVAFEQFGVEVPSTWSVNATNILAQKYFRGTLDTPEREHSLRQVADRVVDTITRWGIEGGYFAAGEAEIFSDELKHLIVHQMGAFNSPVWFNIGVDGVPAQGSACFILSVEDKMESILNWYVEEGTIFKGGSGAGVNLSRIRSSAEPLRGGGTASGPVSFMRGADASAGTIKSGGKTRRAAKMVMLDVDHPDIEEFIWCKATEERKARVLREAGFDMDLDGADSHSIQYQNANNSIRVSDEFMQAVVDDGDWDLTARTDGSVVRTVKARDLMRQFAQAAWECADPGMQFDTTINHWHTSANTGPINGSNPCFPGSAKVHTDKGLVRISELVRRAAVGESFGIYTHDATNPDAPAQRLEITTPDAIMITGVNEIVRLRFSNGAELRATPNHRIFTTNRGYVEAKELTADDEVKVLDLPAPAVSADLRLPVSTDARDHTLAGRRAWQGVNLPEKWSPNFAHYLGWLVGDGCISGTTATTVYGSPDDRETALPRHQALLAEMNGGRELTPSVQANGTLQLRQSRSAVTRFLGMLGIGTKRASEKKLPWSIEQAPPEAVAAFLQGLFDADGCVRDHDKSRYVGLGSASRQLLVDVQRLLTTFGIFSRIYTTGAQSAEAASAYTRSDGTTTTYGSSPMYDLRITSGSLKRFDEAVGFSLPAKAAKLRAAVDEHRWYLTPTTVRMVERTDDGVELTYNLSEPRNHSYVVDGIVVRNCSEYMHLDNSACNLASLNLLKFLTDDDTFDVEGFKAAVECFFTAQEILVGRADYPTEAIGVNSRKFRQLGLGYANLGALLMNLGLPYDSDDGRALAGSITSLMTGHAYHTSARIASRMGPHEGYEENREPMLRVLDQHRVAAAEIGTEAVPAELVEASQTAWDSAAELAAEVGVRNAQASVLAPTGCLVGGSLVPTDGGLVRLRSLGDPDGPKWQDRSFAVRSDDGVQQATKFYVNGLEQVVDVTTERGHHIAGTTKHRVKVVDPQTREWVWRRFADLRPGDLVPLALDQLVGEPVEAVLPPLSEKMAWAGEHHLKVPNTMSADLAELLGYFMGDGSLHSRGLRFCVTNGDFEVTEHLERLAKGLFGLQARVYPQKGYVSVEMHSVRLAEWWRASGFAKRQPVEGHTGKGWTPHIPDALLHSNDPAAYRAFLRGLFEADGTVHVGYPSLSTTSLSFAREVQALQMALGFPTTVRTQVSGKGSTLYHLRLLNLSMNDRWMNAVGFLSGRKAAKVATGDHPQSARYDHIPVTRELLDRAVPVNGALRRNAFMAFRRHGSVSRRLAEKLHVASGDAELGYLLGFFYDRVASAELGDEEFTYDISVPENVTYVANGFVSHNTIGLLMDCDTTGVEPDLGLCKMKKLVGGGTMMIVNQSVPRALRRLGYSTEQIDAIIAYVDEHKTILGAPGLDPAHTDVFACSMGDNAIHYSGHVKMMAAVQPFISGAISKCITGDSLVTTADGLVPIGSLLRGEEPDSFRDEIVEVSSLNGPQKTDAFYYGGVRPVRAVRLRSGHRIEGTPNHRLLVGGGAGLDWKRLDEIEVGDLVATRYGSDMWSTAPARFDDFEVSPSYGCQKAVTIPDEMSDELAFLLGAFVAEGHVTASNYTVHITNADADVRKRVQRAWRDLFGLDARIVDDGQRCPTVSVASKTAVEFLDYLGCGHRASDKRIPGAVLRSPRPTVLAFLSGLALDAYTTAKSMVRWAICVDSPLLLDDLQAVLTNLGIVHSRIEKWNKDYGKSCGEVYAAGRWAQRLVRLVPFAESHKRERAEALLALEINEHQAANVVPIAPRDLYACLPAPRGGRSSKGRGVRAEFAFLCDDRTRYVTRTTLARVAAVPGVSLPQWLRQVLDDDLYFNPVESVSDAGMREVFDISVPTTHAFVANGIVNHNTVNMPEEVTPEDVEQLHLDAWRMGVKAVAIYRDNCKVAQPLSMAKKGDGKADDTNADAAAVAQALLPEPVVETKIVYKPIRERLPRNRRSRTFEFRVADCKGFATIGEYDDGRPGEIFLRVSKQGSTLAGIMDALAISLSHGLQYGVPLRTFVETFTGMRFEPAGMTDDPDIRIATSIMDFLFRKLAVCYLSYEERTGLGIFTTGERTQQTLPGVEEAVMFTGNELPADPPSVESAEDLVARIGATAGSPVTDPDAPICMQCGITMQRAGSCHACPGCGNTSGCS